MIQCQWQFSVLAALASTEAERRSCIALQPFIKECWAGEEDAPTFTGPGDWIGFVYPNGDVWLYSESDNRRDPFGEDYTLVSALSLLAGRDVNTC